MATISFHNTGHYDKVNKISAIKQIRALTSLSLKNTKELVEDIEVYPQTVDYNPSVNPEEIKETMQTLIKMGINVTINEAEHNLGQKIKEAIKMATDQENASCVIYLGHALDQLSYIDSKE